jgi:prepilin-type N-terminal cleavage/methylation domain-containing protein
MKKGYSVIEILVVIGVFAILGVLATQSITLSLRSSKKGDSIVLVKQELDNAAGNIERLLQTASSVIIEGNYCTTNSATPSVGFRNSKGNRGDIACIDSPPSNFIGTTDSRIASSSGEMINYRNRFTSNNIAITNCQFNCYTQNSQTYIDFSVRANVRGVTGAEGATVETSKKILIYEARRK